MSAESDDIFRLKKAAEFLASCKQKEGQARCALFEAQSDTRRAKEKYETLFLECEKRALERNKSKNNYQ